LGQAPAGDHEESLGGINLYLRLLTVDWSTGHRQDVAADLRRRAAREYLDARSRGRDFRVRLEVVDDLACPAREFVRCGIAARIQVDAPDAVAVEHEAHGTVDGA